MKNRYDIIDALRFILASWVAIGHLGHFPLFGKQLAHASGAIHSIDRFVHTLIWGLPAVMAFFVISGFCIHMPFKQPGDIPILRFYLRRYIRVLAPVMVTVILMTQLFPEMHVLGSESILWKSMLWSLVCEEIYYAVYPALRAIRFKVGWWPIMTVTIATSIVLSALFHRAPEWSDIGPIPTALILFPVWISGCILAEKAQALKTLESTWLLWSWRVGAWFTMWVSEFLLFHMGVSKVVSMMYVGGVAYFWIRAELAYYKKGDKIDDKTSDKHRAPSRVLVAAGAFSYSLYLVHPGVIEAVKRFVPDVDIFTRSGWLFTVVSMLAFAYVFYLLVEAPSHRLAKRVRLSSIKIPVVADEMAQPVSGASGG
jgi:peptidoglycan/LPS O-acetylase OafA/YrhL